MGVQRPLWGTWWRLVGFPSFPHPWGKECCPTSTLTVWLLHDPGRSPSSPHPQPHTPYACCVTSLSALRFVLVYIFQSPFTAIVLLPCPIVWVVVCRTQGPCSTLMSSCCSEPDSTGSCTLASHLGSTLMWKSSRLVTVEASKVMCSDNLKVMSVLCLQRCLFYLKVDLCAEEMGNNVRPAAALLGDVNGIVTQVRWLIAFTQ